MTKTAILKEDLPKQDFFSSQADYTLKTEIIKFLNIYIYFFYKWSIFYKIQFNSIKYFYFKV